MLKAVNTQYFDHTPLLSPFACMHPSLAPTHDLFNPNAVGLFFCQRMAAPETYVNLIGFSFEAAFYRGIFDKV